MAAQLFSNTLPEYKDDIENPSLRGSLAFLQQKLKTDFRLLQWSENEVAIPSLIEVDLPSLGNYQQIDIRSKEPIVIVLNIANYPTVAPTIYTDRLDFPKDKLAHIYVAVKGNPPAICYVRGSSNEWYANKRMQDVFVRMGNWFRDAAYGELNTDGSQFEPLRLEGYSGSNSYDYDLLSDVVHNKKSFAPNQNWAVGFFERSRDESYVSFQLESIITPSNIEDIGKAFKQELDKKNSDESKRLYHYGFILWSDSDQELSNYNIDFPHNWEEFKAFCTKANVAYQNLEDIIAKGDGNHYVYFPVVIAIKRPLPLIGFSSNIEFVNFRFNVDTPDISEGRIVNNFPVALQVHNQILTPQKAKLISGNPDPLFDLTLVFGCGALGSKIVLHLAKSGQLRFFLIDPDILSPHNLVRHSVGAEYIGSNKAFAISESIQKLFPKELFPAFWGEAIKQEVFSDVEKMKRYSSIFDFTASDAFFNRLVNAEGLTESMLFSGRISNFGKLGILFREGKNRNPRIDDLQAALYSQHSTHLFIRNWLIDEQQANNNGSLTVQVGVGCNSETTILADETISAHSAFMAASVRTEITKKEYEVGKIKLHRIINKEEYHIETETFLVQPFTVMKAVNNATWSVRFKDNIINTIVQQSQKAKDKETGGVFIGVVNHKNKTIHVTDLISAPPDSKADAICFHRGHQGLSEQIKLIVEGSGGQLGYVGEWHSHPHGPNGLSTTDLQTVKKCHKELALLTTPLPVFLTIITPGGVLPFVF